MPKVRNVSSKIASKICNYANGTYDNAKINDIDNARAWDICHNVFLNAFNSNNSTIDYDYLALNLGMYLANWGMYRGSSFIGDYNYRVFIPIVKELFVIINGTLKYKVLIDIEFDKYDSSTIDLLFELSDSIQEIFNNILNNNAPRDISKTLITKILLGTLGCVPAYDRYFYEGIVKNNVACGTFNRNSINDLKAFYQANHQILEQIRNNMTNFDNPSYKYPQAKLLDMGFWEIGYRGI